MEHKTTAAFWREYHALDSNMQRSADKQFSLLKVDPQHPSLQFKKIGERGGNEIWSARVTQSYRAVAIKRPNGYLWFWIGDHRTYESLID